MLEALKKCTDEGVAGDGDDSLGGQLRKAIGDAPLAEGALSLKDGESLRRRYCSLVAAGFDASGTPTGPALIEEDAAHSINGAAPGASSSD